MESKPINGVVPLPTQATEILETVHVPTEKRAHYPPTYVAGGVLEVGVHLDLLREFGGFYFDVARLDGFHVVFGAHEGYAPRSDWVLMSVRVNPRVNDPAEQIVHYERQSVRVQQPVQTPHEDGGVGVQARAGAVHGVGVGQDPGDHLYLLVPHSRGGDLVVVVAPLGRVLRARLQQQLNALLRIED